MKPLDHPTPERPHRLYFALTNHCNRACPWCSTYSSPGGQTFFDPREFTRHFPEDGPFEVQLEGGEPTIHPDFWSLVELARAHPRCVRLVLCTNGVALPRTRERLRGYVERLGAPLTVKLSANHHLLERDPGLLELASALRGLLEELGGLFVLNVRLRKGVAEDDQAVLEAVRRAGLEGAANVFFLQRYGLAKDEASWEPPFVVGTRFTLINPDGRTFGPELVARSEAMAALP